MSFQAMSWATEQKLPAMQKLVLLMLANRTNHDTGECFPSMARLAADCGMSKDSVRRAISQLSDAGILSVKHNSKHGVNLPNSYRMNMPGILADTEGWSQPASRVLADSDQGGSTQRPRVVADSNHYNQEIEPIIEPVIEPKAPRRRFDPAQVDLPHWMPRDLWAEWCAHRSQIREPITEIAAKKQIKFLDDQRKSGASPEEIVTQSIRNGWQGLFAVAKTRSGANVTRQQHHQAALQQHLASYDFLEGLEV